MFRKNVGGQFLYFQMVTTAGVADAAATVTVKRCIDGSTQASGGGTVTHRGGGQYEYSMSQADTNGNDISFQFTATGDVPVEKTIVTTAADPTDAVRFGLTALPNANAEAAGGLYTRGSGAGQINQPANGQVDANTVKVNGTAQTARDLGASVLLSAGSGTGQLDFTSGVVKANATQFVGGTIPAPNVTGVPLVDLKYTLGTISPATAGSVRADAVTGAVGSVTAGVTVLTNSDKTGYALTSGERTSIADALLDETNGVEPSWTLRQVLRIMFSVLGGKLDGAATTTIHTRDQADGKNRVTATVDANGNRTAVTLDAS